jgi:hypothetical protein
MNVQARLNEAKLAKLRVELLYVKKMACNEVEPFHTLATKPQLEMKTLKQTAGLGQARG